MIRRANILNCLHLGYVSSQIAQILNVDPKTVPNRNPWNSQEPPSRTITASSSHTHDSDDWNPGPRRSVNDQGFT